MRHQMPNTADLAPPGAPLALASELVAETVLEANFPGLSSALTRTYGKGGWFMFWDEDLSGQPIAGTISIAYGKETLIVG